MGTFIKGTLWENTKVPNTCKTCRKERVTFLLVSPCHSFTALFSLLSSSGWFLASPSRDLHTIPKRIIFPSSYKGVPVGTGIGIYTELEMTE